jgi:MFS family permease
MIDLHWSYIVSRQIPIHEQVIYDVDRWKPQVVVKLLLGYFLLFGVLIGAKGVLWVELLTALQLSEGVFGSVLLLSPLTSVVLLLLSGKLCAWAGKKPLALAGLVLLAGALIGLATTRSLGGLIGALVLSGMGNALLEIAMNTTTLDWEHATRRSIMNIMHAGFSAGAMLGALGAGGLLGLGWSYSQVLIILVLLCGFAIIATLLVRYPPEDANTDENADVGTTIRLLLRPLIIGLALLSLLGVVGESVAGSWSVIYLRGLGAPAFIGGAAYALFNATMLVGRLANAPLVTRYGTLVSLFVSGTGLMLSALLLMLPGGVPLAVIAFALMGLAVAGVIPTALSAAAQVVPGNNGAVAGGIIAAAYIGLILCPPLVGWLAEIFSLQLALLVVGLSGVGVVWLARGVREVKTT